MYSAAFTPGNTVKKVLCNTQFILSETLEIKAEAKKVSCIKDSFHSYNFARLLSINWENKPLLKRKILLWIVVIYHLIF